MGIFSQTGMEMGISPNVGKWGQCPHSGIDLCLRPRPYLVRGGDFFLMRGQGPMKVGNPHPIAILAASVGSQV